MAQPVQGNAKAHAATATVQSVSASSAAAQTILAANPARLGGFLVNDSDKVVYVKYGTAASTTSYTDKVAVGGKHNMADGPRCYTGVVTAIWDSGPTGAMRVTELS